MARCMIYLMCICCLITTFKLDSALREEYKDDHASMTTQQYGHSYIDQQPSFKRYYPVRQQPTSLQSQTPTAHQQSNLVYHPSSSSQVLRLKSQGNVETLPVSTALPQKSHQVTTSNWLQESSSFKKLHSLVQDIIFDTPPTNTPIKQIRLWMSLPLEDALISKDQRLQYQTHYYSLYLEALIQDDHNIQNIIESGSENGWSSLGKPTLLEIMKWLEVQDQITAHIFKDLIYADFIYSVIVSDSEIPIGQFLLFAIDKGDKKAFSDIDFAQRLSESFFLKLWEKAIRKKEYDIMHILLDQLLLKQDTSKRLVYLDIALASNEAAFRQKFTKMILKILSQKPDISFDVMNELFLTAADHEDLKMMKTLASIDKYEIPQKCIDDAFTESLTKKHYTVVQAFLSKTFNERIFPSEQALDVMRHKKTNIPANLKELLPIDSHSSIDSSRMSCCFNFRWFSTMRHSI